MSDFMHDLMRGWFLKNDTKTLKTLSQGEVNEYLESWFYCDASIYDLDLDVVNAFSEQHSLVEWFGTSVVEYDYDAARAFYQKLMTDNAGYIQEIQEEQRLNAVGFQIQQVVSW
jgi:hypothetical protein